MDADVFIEPIGRLMNEFSKLPGVGGKTAQRYAYRVIDMSESEAKAFADAILAAKRKEIGRASCRERV